MKEFLARMSDDLYNWLKREAFQQDKSMAQIVREALQEQRRTTQVVREALQEEGGKSAD